MAVNEGEVGRAVRRDSPWWTNNTWAAQDRDLRAASASGIDYRPTPLANLSPNGLYLLYGPRRVGKTVAIKRKIVELLESGVDPQRICRVSVDGWRANRLGTLYDYVSRIAAGSVGRTPRYWFIDEITATTGDWWFVVKDLRDNTPLGDDCVVLTGSSNADLDAAVKALAGRRGSTEHADRTLLPMSFASFCRVAGFGNLPDVDLRPDELCAAHALDTWHLLEAHTDTLSIAWQAFMEVGGYPQAVADWTRRSHVDESTWRALWDVVRGEALTKGFTEPALLAVLSGLSERIAAHVVQQTLAADADLPPAALSDRLDALVQSFLLWRCPAGGANRLPDLARRQKYYFIDSMPARLAELVHGSPPVDIGRIAEQQLGVQLLQWNERVRPGSTRTSGWITHHRTDRNEVDFAGRCADNGEPMTAIESKYSSSSWRREALTLRNSLGGGLLATRDVLDIERDESVWAVPVSMIAWALTASGH